MYQARADYSIKLITALLEGYSDLAFGQLPVDKLIQYGIKIDRSKPHAAHFERPAILKADIDRAIRYSLRPTERCVLIGWLMAGFRREDCAFWINSGQVVLEHIASRAIRKMSRYLNTGKAE